VHACACVFTHGAMHGNYFVALHPRQLPAQRPMVVPNNIRVRVVRERARAARSEGKIVVDEHMKKKKRGKYA